MNDHGKANTPSGGNTRPSPLTDRRTFIGGAIGAAAGAGAGVLSYRYIPPLFADDSSLEQGTLRILSGKDVSYGGQRQRLVDQWNLLHPDHEAYIVELSSVADQQLSSMRVKAQTDKTRANRDEPGVYDIFNLDVVWVAEFAAREHIRPLDESRLDTRGFLDAPLDTCRYNGELWALPFNTDAGLLFYRSDLVSKPRSWNDIIAETARVFSDPEIMARNPELEAGYVGQLANYEGLTVNTLEAIWGAGGRVVDADGRVAVNSKQAEEGLERLWSGLNHNTRPPVILGDALGYKEKKSLEAFKDGRVLFLRHWPQAYLNLVAQGATRDAGGRPGGRSAGPGVARLPYLGNTGPSALGGQNLAVSAYSTKPRAAKALVEFLTSPRSEQFLLERGGLPATREVVYRDLMGRIKDYPHLSRQYGYVEPLYHTLNTGAHPRPKTPHYPHFSNVFATKVHEALVEQSAPPDDAWLEQLSAKLKLALDGK